MAEMRIRTLFLILTAFFLTRVADPAEPAAGVPVGVRFEWETLARKGHCGDNWCMTWAADGNLYTMMDDGCGFDEDHTMWNCRMIRISGGPDFTAKDTWECEGWPFHPPANDGKGFYGYGTYAVGKRIYTWVWKSERNGYRRPIANRLIYTDDFGRTFRRWDGKLLTKESFAETAPGSFFFYKEQPTPRAGRDAYAFNWIAFCQNGQANSAAKDDFVYMYAVEQYDARRLAMIRVSKDKLCDKSAYEYLVAVDAGGRARWSRNPAERGTTHVFPAKNYNGLDWLWCSWHPSVVYNEPLDRYIMVSYGISDSGTSYWSAWCRQDSESAATVVMLHSKNPWGPWTLFYEQPEWKTPGEVPPEWGFDAAASRTYQFKLNPKWIEDGGRTMYLHWSDAGGKWGDGHWGHSRFWYRWNQVKIHLELGPRPAPEVDD